MLTRIRQLPSPALVIASIALIVAVGGGTFAIASSDNAKDKKIAKKIANKQIKKKAPSLSVKHAVSADTAANANHATTADNASQLGGLDPSEYKTASNYTQSSAAKALTGTVATVGSPIQVTTEGTRRVIATGVVHATNGVVGAGVFLVCHITIDGTSGVNDTDYASPAGGFTVVDASVSPMASAVVGAGTHTVTLLCSAAGGGTPQANVADDALATWAVAG
jgi:hypothetical protein